ncbi:MAG: hypothetical protein WD038_00335 [Balneolales bacterium]
MRYINSFIGLVLIMMLIVACGDSQDQRESFDDDVPPADQPTQTQPPEEDDLGQPPAGADQDQTDTEMGEEPQQEFVQQMQSRLDQAEEELDDARQSGEALGEEQDTQQYDQIEERIDNTRDQLDELEGTGAENWEQISQEVMNNVNNIEEDIQTLSGGGQS